MRNKARELFLAGVAAADPRAAVSRCLAWHDGALSIAGEPICDPVRIHVVAVGKAALPMAEQVLEIIPARRLAGSPLVVTSYEMAKASERLDLRPARHPLPDANGLLAGRAIADRVTTAGAEDLVLVLLSGGASALAPLPPDSVPLSDKIEATRLLLACGADITEINTVRKHLSRLKGGGLARLVAPARLHTLILSDVIGDDPSSIASGPTVPDPTTYADAVAVFTRYGVWDQLPASVRTHLFRGQQGDEPETVKPGDPAFAHARHTIIGSNRISLQAVLEAATEAGLRAEVYSDALTGEAREAACVLARSVGAESGGGQVLVAGGETTVTLRGSGKGGRNQEFALAFALAAEAVGLPPGWVLLSAGTDGIDGPTEAAGAIVDATTLNRIRAATGDPQALLADNDAYHALELSHDLLITGATGTNVADLQILITAPATRTQ